jgi:hypothetical protein
MDGAGPQVLNASASVFVYRTQVFLPLVFEAFSP